MVIQFVQTIRRSSAVLVSPVKGGDPKIRFIRGQQVLTTRISGTVNPVRVERPRTYDSGTYTRVVLYEDASGRFYVPYTFVLFVQGKLKARENLTKVYPMTDDIAEKLQVAEDRDHNRMCMVDYKDVDGSFVKAAQREVREGFGYLEHLTYEMRDRGDMDYRVQNTRFRSAIAMYLYGRRSFYGLVKGDWFKGRAVGFHEWRVKIDMGEPRELPESYAQGYLSYGERRHHAVNRLQTDRPNEGSELQHFIEKKMAGVEFGLEHFFEEVREVPDLIRDLMFIEEDWFNAVKAEDWDFIDDLQRVRHRAPSVSAVPRINILKLESFNPSKDKTTVWNRVLTRWNKVIWTCGSGDWQFTLDKGLQAMIHRTVVDMLQRKAVVINVEGTQVHSPFRWGGQGMVVDPALELYNAAYSRYEDLPRWAQAHLEGGGKTHMPMWGAEYKAVEAKSHNIPLRKYDCPHCGPDSMCLRDCWDARLIQCRCPQERDKDDNIIPDWKDYVHHGDCHAVGRGALRGKSGHWRCLCGYYVPDRVVTLTLWFKLSNKPEASWWTVRVEVFGHAYLRQLFLARPKLASMVMVSGQLAKATLGASKSRRIETA